MIKGKFKKIYNKKKKFYLYSADNVFWSPVGKFCVLATLKRSIGLLIFFNVEKLDIISKAEHFMCSSCEWDSTGRYFTTTVSQYHHQSENGFIIWNVIGEIQHRLKIEKFW